MFVKLFGSILDSTVWQEPATTRVVWITMLAMTDESGFVAASVPGLAHRAGVTLEECETALAAFLRPDPYSRTKEHEGRRIEADDGGVVPAELREVPRDPEQGRSEGSTRRDGFRVSVDMASTDVDKRRPTSTMSTKGEGEAEAEGEEEEDGEAERLPPAPVLDVRDPEPDPPLEVVRRAHRGRFGGDPVWDEKDIAKYLPKLLEQDREVLAEVARQFFAADGRAPKDTYWKTRGWPLHLFVTQGIPRFTPGALEVVNQRRADAAKERKAQQHRADAEAAAAEERRREAAELAALSAPVRAWRETLTDLGGRVGAVLSLASGSSSAIGWSSRFSRPISAWSATSRPASTSRQRSRNARAERRCRWRL